jgi:4-hydroxy-3-polyprenylbenzoate decarboxylase
MKRSAKKELIVGVSGASGARLAVRFLDLLAMSGQVSRLHLIVSEAALRVAENELGKSLANGEEYRALLSPAARRSAWLRLHPDGDLSAPISSGSYAVDGMAVIPCSAGTLASIARGISRGLLTRAADVALKERRPLVLAFRESPYSLVHLENMREATLAGAIVMPPSPPFYIDSPSIDRLMDAYLARVGRALGVRLSDAFVWQGPRRPK